MCFYYCLSPIISRYAPAIEAFERAIAINPVLGRGALKRHLQQCVDASASMVRRMHDQALNVSNVVSSTAAGTAASASTVVTTNVVNDTNSNSNGSSNNNSNSNGNISSSNTSTNYAFVESST